MLPEPSIVFPVTLAASVFMAFFCVRLIVLPSVRALELEIVTVPLLTKVKAALGKVPK